MLIHLMSNVSLDLHRIESLFIFILDGLIGSDTFKLNNIASEAMTYAIYYYRGVSSFIRIFTITRDTRPLISPVD